MLELTAYEARRRLVGTAWLTGGLVVIAVMFTALYPSTTRGIDIDQYVAQLPPFLRDAFGIRALGSIEGFLSAELYAFAWVLLLGLYVAYSAAGLLADDVERGRIDVLLSLPVTRARVVAEKFLSLLLPIVVLNVVVPPVVYATTVLVDAPVSPVRLVAVHALSVPYLLACGAIGLAISAVASRADDARRIALVAVFGLFLLKSLANTTDYGWIGALAPMRYYDPSSVLVDGHYDSLGALILLAATLVLVVASQVYFTRRDV